MHVKEISRNFQGKKVAEIILQNDQGLEARFCSLGARLTGLSVPTTDGGREELILTLADLDDEARYHTYYGATVGRVAGRIAGSPPLPDMPEAHLVANEGPNHLHGGPEGLDLAVWDYQVTVDADGQGASVTFCLQDPAGHNGYPGTLEARVIHRLDQANRWTVRYEAETDAPTYWNPTNHVYFNLNGDAQAPITNHCLVLEADAVIPLDAAGLPVGAPWSVADHPVFDFRGAGQRLERGLAQAATNEQLAIRGGGYDHAFCLNQPVAVGQALAAASSGVCDPQGQLTLPGTARRVRVWTDRPCAVIYTHNHQVDGLILGGQPQVPYIGVSFETQVAPDAPHQPAAGSIRLEPGQVSVSETCFEVSW